MRKWFRPNEEKRHEKAKKRLSRVPDEVVLTWAMDSVWATQAGLERYQVHRDTDGLLEARLGLINLLAATDVLSDRKSV